MKTLYASSAAASAAYYASYLTEAPGEAPGRWCGHQAEGLGLTGPVTVEALELLLSGHDPDTGNRLGRELVDRYRTDGTVTRAVAGFDATFSAPKSLSVWWALTGDHRLLDAHDAAVTVTLDHLERFGSTTRRRANGGRQHVESQGLSMATFCQTTSRADDPQIHTHAVVSAKVQTAEGNWLALDARFLKRHQQMLGGLYQSVLRSELTARFGVAWGAIVNCQAELAGVPAELLTVFSKRTSQVDAALRDKLAEFRDRQGRDPTRWERAALTREAAVDTRSHKSGAGARDLSTRWLAEAAELGWTPRRLVETLDDSRTIEPAARVTVEQVLDALSAGGSTWARPDVLRTICGLTAPMPGMSAKRWEEVLERACDQVLAGCINLDPDTSGSRRVGDGRSLWIEPVAPQYSSEQILAEEEHVIAWSIDAHETHAASSATVDETGLDVMQAGAAAAVAGNEQLVLVVGPAGAGKTRTLERAVADLRKQARVVFGVAPTAKAARTLQRDARVNADTAAKLLHEWSRTDRPRSSGIGCQRVRRCWSTRPA